MIRAVFFRIHFTITPHRNRMTSIERSVVVETPANFKIVNKIDGFEHIFHEIALHSLNYVFIGSFAYELEKHYRMQRWTPI
jgi:hypothetical protein